MIRSVAIALMLASIGSAQEGSQVFISRCMQCHDSNSDSHAPLPDALRSLPWQDILKTLETGSMKAIGDQFSTISGQSRARSGSGDERILRGRG